MFRTRERGMSYWPFVVTLLAFFVMTYMWYEAGAEQDNRRDQIASLNTKLAAEKTKSSARYTELQELEAVTGYTKDTDVVPDKDKIATGIREALAAMREHAVLKFQGDKFSATGEGGRIEKIGTGEVVINYLPPTAELPSGDNLKVEVMWPIVIEAFKRMLVDVNHHVQLKDTAEQARTGAAAANQTELGGKDATIGDLQRQIQAEQARAAEQATELRDQIATLESQLESARAALDEAQTQSEEAVAKAANEISQLKSEITRLVDREVPYVTEGHDGEVLTSGAGLVIVNRGKKHMLMPGTVFTVYKRVKGGGEVQVGTIKATVVDDETARCSVLEASDVISGGDMISSGTYSPDRQLHFFLLGDFNKMGRSQAAARLEQLGAMVDDEVSTMTHYVVVGTAPSGADSLETSADYLRAKQYGIKVISENQLASFTQY